MVNTRLHVGDKVKVKSVSLATESDKTGRKHGAKDLLPAEVVYIHPKRRFYTVAYSFVGGKVRECFKLMEV